MFTWVGLWWICLLPFPIVFLVGALPNMGMLGGELQGGIVREWFLNHLAIPFLNEAAADELILWFKGASYSEELIFQTVIAADITLLLLPVTFLLGEIIIRLSAWAQTTSHSLKSQSIR